MSPAERVERAALPRSWILLRHAERIRDTVYIIQRRWASEISQLVQHNRLTIPTTMKVLVSIALLAAVVLAEPPRYRPQYQQQRQYYFTRQQEEAADNAPYAASGWKPTGPAFNLPERQFAGAQQSQQQYGAPIAAQQPQQQYGAPSAAQQPQQQYGAPSAAQQPQQRYGAPTAPQQQYGAPATPQQQYGAPSGPQREYGIPEESTTTENPSNDDEEVSTVQGITSSEPEAANAANELEDEEQDDKQQPQQTGEYYVALPDGRLQHVRYVSRQDVEAMKYFAKIRAENVEPLRGPIYAYAPLQKLQIVPAGLQVSVAPVAAVAPAEQTTNSKPQKLEIEPVAAQVQYQYDNPSSVVPLANPLNAAYTTYTANYQVPAAAGDSRFLLTFQ
ncbi:mediator of RNA polymerase II transcription subunit 15 [Harpegnathos saltator]|uniref:mediator of RNA polymerase II transcription subunit 15 n=1 Tax=Harpegnathos saltator TaxID=610380 RepID=UPI000DBED8F2|nr:mediator of RNA polymerase II transcription subunit 15 [Harpegnathos saltator]